MKTKVKYNHTSFVTPQGNLISEHSVTFHNNQIIRASTLEDLMFYVDMFLTPDQIKAIYHACNVNSINGVDVDVNGLITKFY